MDKGKDKDKDKDKKKKDSMSNASFSPKDPKAKVKVTVSGDASIRNYLKSMGSHDLLRSNEEIVLARQIQILLSWEHVRNDMEAEIQRPPTYGEWCEEVRRQEDDDDGGLSTASPSNLSLRLFPIFDLFASTSSASGASN